MNKYRVSFILDTREYQDSIDSLLDKVIVTMESLESKVLEKENLGNKPFARITEKSFIEGIYFIVKCEADAKFPKNLKEKIKLDKNIYRIFIERI